MIKPPNSAGRTTLESQSISSTPSLSLASKTALVQKLLIAMQKQIFSPRCSGCRDEAPFSRRPISCRRVFEIRSSIPKLASHNAKVSTVAIGKSDHQASAASRWHISMFRMLLHIMQLSGTAIVKNQGQNCRTLCFVSRDSQD